MKHKSSMLQLTCLDFRHTYFADHRSRDLRHAVLNSYRMECCAGARNFRPMLIPSIGLVETQHREKFGQLLICSGNRGLESQHWEP